MKRFGIALSGGGHRASLFGLGVMLYLADAEKLSDAASISSVSGGSITNGYLAQVPKLETLKGSQFQQAVLPLARALSRTGTLWGWWGTYVYLLVTVSLFALAALWPWWLDDAWLVRVAANLQVGVRTLLALLSVALVWQLLAVRRAVICRWALQRTLLKDDQGRPTLLENVRRDQLDHVLCATDLHVGEHVYFSGKFVYSFRLGLGTPGPLTVAHAAQASAGFPGGFMPTYLPTAPLKFSGGTNSCTWLALLDGGLYDNMADQWQFGLRERRDRNGSAIGKIAQDCEELIVVNACNNMQWSSVASLWIPLLGEFFSLLRTINVLFDNTTTIRRRFLLDKFSRQSDFRGVLITLEQSPFRIPLGFESCDESATDLRKEQAMRAKNILKDLNDSTSDPHTEAAWKALVEHNQTFPTTLRALGVRRSAQLILQAYVTAMANLHVILGYPKVHIPKLTDIEAYLASGKSF